MNGEPLPVSHGFPVRMVVPGLYGYVSATKWVVDLKLTTWEDDVAYWVPRGWAREAPVKTMSRIDVPRQRDVPAGTVAIAGVAWAPHRGISAVEVQVDDGDLAPGPSGRGPERRQLGAVGGRMGRRPGRARGDRPRRTTARGSSSPRTSPLPPPTAPRAGTGATYRVTAEDLCHH